MPHRRAAPSTSAWCRGPSLAGSSRWGFGAFANALRGAARSEANRRVRISGHAAVLCFYHSVICKPAHPQTNQHTARDIETLSALTDCMLEGDLDRYGDSAMQRYKALEISLADNSWEIAKELDVVERHAPYLASEEERRRGSRQRLQEVRLHNALSNLRTRAGGPAVADR